MVIAIQNLKYELGSRVLFDEVNWSIYPGERIGLIGYNGTGKSTMLKLLVNDISPSGGQVQKAKDITIGYLHQDLMSEALDQSIVEVAMTAFGKATEIKKQLDALEANPKLTEDEALLETYTHLIGEFSELDGYNLEHKVEEVLAGLGFSQEQMNKPYATFSGGWRMRVLLAKMILQNPDLLLLDEPTNHLDLPSIEWLEKYLQNFNGAVIIVSHDKYFLDRICNKIVELYQRKLHFYTGNYSFYEAEKEQRATLQQRAYENQQDFIRQQERFIERFKAKASKATQAQSVQKRLDRLDIIEEVSVERPNLRINFSIDRRPGKIISKLQHFSKKYDTNVIFKNSNLEIERGDKIALIGANGKGKSTLLRLISGLEGVDTGTREGGHNVDEAFYAQHQIESLNLTQNILGELAMAGSNKTDQELRTILGCFLFSGDDVEKKIGVLSGGEKARVALAKVIISKANFLMLDEPTNHLDLPSIDLLIEALQKYEGTFIMVSHDRYFVSKCANKIWHIENNELKEFVGNYDEWHDWQDRQATKKSTEVKTPTPVEKKTATPTNNNSNNATNEIAKNKKAIDNLQKKLAKAEEAIAITKQELDEYAEKLNNQDIYKDANALKEVQNKMAAVQQKQLQQEQEYEQYFNELINLENQ
jgi:ATP-binding cassette, subfamily F, member 3